MAIALRGLSLLRKARRRYVARRCGDVVAFVLIGGPMERPPMGTAPFAPWARPGI